MSLNLTCRFLRVMPVGAKSLLQLGRYLFQVYYINKKICTLEAQADLGVESLLCSIQLLFVLLEQLLKSGGELIFSLL